MNAVLESVEVVETPSPIPGRDRSWIDAVLHEWGDWIWKHRDYEGYPTAEHVTAFLNGAGGGIVGHRILCRDFPAGCKGLRIRTTHAVWMMLPEHEGIVVYAEYVPGVRDDGRLWTRAEKCMAVKVPEETFRKRLQRARSRIYEWSRARKY